MKYGPFIFLGILCSVAASWLGVVVAPHLQFGDQAMAVVEGTLEDYPVTRAGMARQGAEVYRQNGCYYCHTQQVRSRDEGSDIARGWGTRRTVARDYLRDQPVMLGQLRYGPDLANIGARETNTHTLYLKLYNPRIVMPGSTMPRYPYLFETRRLHSGAHPSTEALRIPAAFAPAEDIEVVPGPEAKTLVAYLLSLRSEKIFFEVFPPVPPRKETNAVEDLEGITNTPALNVTDTNSPTPSEEANSPPTP